MSVRICVDARALYRERAGIARYISEMLKALEKYSDYELVLITHRKIQYPEIFGKKVIIVWDKNWRYVPGSLWYVIRANKLANRYHCDIIWGTQHILPLKKCKRMKYIVTWHDLVYKVAPETMSLYNRLITALFYKHSLRQADHIVAVSESTRSDLLRYYPWISSTKISVVYEGKTSIFTLSKNASALIQKPYLFVLGSLEPRKNIIALVKAFTILHASNANLKLVISGSKGWKNSSLFSIIEKSSARHAIYLTGYVSDETIGNYFCNADLFVFPSVYEGFGLPLLEAEGCCPVVANDIPVFRELSKGFKNLYFCDFSKSQEEVALLLEKLLNQKLEPLCFHPNYEKVFSWKNAVSELKKIINRTKSL